MFGALLLSLVGQIAPPVPGATVRLANWDSRGEVTVRVESLSAGPVRWTDGAGAVHQEPTITYTDPQHGRLVTTLAWFLKHTRPVLIPVGPPRPITELDWPFYGPLKDPGSNQDIKDGIARPADMLYSIPKQRDYYSVYRAKTGAAR